MAHDGFVGVALTSDVTSNLNIAQRPALWLIAGGTRPFIMARTAKPQFDTGRKARFFFPLLGLWLLLAAPAQALIQFDVFLGYDGTVREASWFPIVCEIKNDGPPFAGLIEVSPEQYGKGQTQQMPVELPTGTLKRVTLPAFAAGRYPQTWNVRLLDERGKVQAEQTALRPRRQIGWEIPLIGSLARTASGAPVLRPILRNQPDAQPASARMQPSIFPDNPLVLEGLDALYLSSEVAASLRNSQVNAVLGWLNAGGHLIVGVEQIADITASPWLKAIMPVEPKEIILLPHHGELQEWLRTGAGMTNLPAGYRRNNPGKPINAAESSAANPFADLPHDGVFELADLPVATGPLREGRVVLASGDTPLIITGNRGAGRVTALMFSPEREPLRSWKNLPTFWAKLAEVPGILYASSDYYQGYGPSADGIFGAMIDSRQVHKLPIGWLLLLLLIYLLVIGPFDRWWLKRIGRPMLTWITFPCYVVMFSLMIYFIGYKLRAGESEYNELHVVDVLRNGARAELRGRTYAAIYSPSNARYPFASQQKFATLRGEFVGAGAGQATEKATVRLSGDSFKAEVFVPVWTSQLYVSDWWQSAPLPLAAGLEWRGGQWRLTVTNDTDRAVTGAQMVVGDRIYSVGEIAAGRTKTMQLTETNSIALDDFVRSHGQNFQNAVQQRQRAFGESSGAQLADLPNASMAASFVSQLGAGPNNHNNQTFVVPPGLDLSRVVDHGNAVLLAWAPNYGPVKSLNQFKPRRESHNTLWRVPITIIKRPD